MYTGKLLLRTREIFHFKVPARLKQGSDQTRHSQLTLLQCFPGHTISHAFLCSSLSSTMASAMSNETAIINILKEMDLEEYEELCLNKGLRKVKHLKDVNSSLLQRELGKQITIYITNMPVPAVSVFVNT